MDKYEQFKKQVYSLVGIDLSSYKEKQMKRRIQSLLSRNNYKDFDDYFEGLKKDNRLLDEFINYLTINVSEFFRNPTQWDVLEKEILPELIKNNRKLNLWSSACSTGEEPYTLAMLLTKYFDLKDIKIKATDIDLGAIEKAKMGVYSEKSLQNVPKEFVHKYFEKVGNSYKIHQSIKDCVEFKRLDLLQDRYPDNCQLILCRNVLIYFTEEAKVDIYKKFNESLSTDGILFVGSTEQIIMPDRYNFKPAKTFFYKRIT
ncbi:chemotaxis protein methyltransferase CheR [Proteiniborus ethanoligenes]|uniref:protein-glutamate O-methyltransferase n=1 Tax=Proteiniborus ethanoligenes TaxID=415015 RepID=A0A1H3NA69_9FIRM|nr:protein-glutamate O-methyltransferase CheR [Proteiniborus ethanoligenes]TAH63622.1 MAG: protein-glutamate O-methyltransferase CheR [Gottschalkiaceae bacterium]SDY85837.1 chemotaxis protein methyltransferase CheR [Proteiniborus ethanoligenes]